MFILVHSSRISSSCQRTQGSRIVEQLTSGIMSTFGRRAQQMHACQSPGNFLFSTSPGLHTQRTVPSKNGTGLTTSVNIIKVIPHRHFQRHFSLDDSKLREVDNSD